MIVGRFHYVVHRGAPDPTLRDGGAYPMRFSERCASNAIENGFRALTGHPLHPIQLVNPRSRRLVWVSPETCREVVAPRD